MKKEIEVSVLIVSYNAVWDKLRKTIVSALIQRNVNFEIIIADDGSENNFFSDIRCLFEHYNFREYKLLPLPQNMGTCKNIHNGLIAARGKYVKTIAPGDYFYDNDTLSKWCFYMMQNDCRISFGDAVCYTYNNKKYHIMPMVRKPQSTSIYSLSHYNFKAVMLNYIFLNDAVLGSNFLIDRDTLKKYLECILEDVKYAEDMIYNLTVSNNERMGFYNVPVVWYEYGTGISTNGDLKWKQIISSERNSTLNIVKHNNCFSGMLKMRFHIGIRVLLSNRIKWMKYIIFPELIYWKLYKDRHRTYTRTPDDTSYMERL